MLDFKIKKNESFKSCILSKTSLDNVNIFTAVLTSAVLRAALLFVLIAVRNEICVSVDITFQFS
jgi:hypothetical protein